MSLYQVSSSSCIVLARRLKFHYDVPLLLVFSEGPSLDVNDGVRTVEDIDTAVRDLEHADRARDAREDQSDPRADAVPSSREL